MTVFGDFSKTNEILNTREDHLKIVETTLIFLIYYCSSRFHRSCTDQGSAQTIKSRVPVMLGETKTHGYVNSEKRCVTDRFHGFARNRVTGDVDP